MTSTFRRCLILLKSGAVRIPGFQRNFVWDQVRASKLIKSLILGIPVPQLFLYEQARNRFLVIDGQQRLMSIYLPSSRESFRERRSKSKFVRFLTKKERFPMRSCMTINFSITSELKLSEKLPNQTNKFHGLNYSTLGDYKTQFDLRPIRNIIVKQNSPANDNSSMYEVFNRLNTGGINLRPQEIRTSMYHSGFYDMLYRVNTDSRWRTILKSPEPDLHMKDIEILLRGLAMLISGDQYAPSMVRFLNQFSRMSESNDSKQNEYLYKLLISFLEACDDLPNDAFVNPKNNQFNIALFEAVFTATCDHAFKKRRILKGEVDGDEVSALERDRQFLSAALEGTTRTANVETRLSRARALISTL